MLLFSFGTKWCPTQWLRPEKRNSLYSTTWLTDTTSTLRTDLLYYGGPWVSATLKLGRVYGHEQFADSESGRGSRF
jgi:hypothetical protein